MLVHRFKKLKINSQSSCDDSHVCAVFCRARSSLHAMILMSVRFSVEPRAVYPPVCIQLVNRAHCQDTDIVLVHK